MIALSHQHPNVATVKTTTLNLLTANPCGLVREGYFRIPLGYFRQASIPCLLVMFLIILSSHLFNNPAMASASATKHISDKHISDRHDSGIGNTGIESQSSPSELKTLRMCLYDMIGQNGPISKLMTDYQAKSLHWGVRLKFKHYLSDRLAAEDFQSGQCDMVNLPGIRARNFNAFTGSLNAIGAIPDYKHLKVVLTALSSPKASKLMKQDAYEIAAIMPTGALYGFVTDRALSSPSQLVGKKITVLESAPESEFLIKQTGMIPVASSINNAIQKFNSHLVDVTGAPAIAYELMEMHKGLEPSGGIINWPFHQTTMQLVIRWEKFPQDYGQHSRNYLQSFLSDSFVMLESYEQKIPTKYWIDVDGQSKEQWIERHRYSRQQLIEQGIYHASALSLFKKVRCKFSPALSECSMTP